MIRVLVYFLVLALVLAGSHWLMDEKGYVLISFNQTTIEGTLVSFGFMALLSMVSLYVFARVAGWLWRLVVSPSRHWSWRRHRRQQQVLEQGLWAMLQGDWESLERHWRKAPVSEEWQTLKQAALVKASMEKEQWVQARAQLEALPTNEHTVSLKASLEPNDDNTAVLAKLAKDKQASTHTLMQYGEALIAQRAFSDLKPVLVKLSKRASMDVELWRRKVAKWFSSVSAHERELLWNVLPKSVQQHVEEVWVQSQLAKGELSKEEARLQKWVKKGQFEQLASVLLHLRGEGSLALQQAVQHALKAQSDNVYLLLSLASLALAGKDAQLAAKVFDQLADKVPAHWKAMQKRAYIEDGQYQKACFIDQ